MNQQYTTSTEVNPMTLIEVKEIGEWVSTIRSSVKQERETSKGRESDPNNDFLGSSIAKLLTLLELRNVFVELDCDVWEDEAAIYTEDIDKISDVDLLTLRKLLSYHWHKSKSANTPDGYWRDLAMNGHLLRILSRFENIYYEVAARTLV